MSSYEEEITELGERLSEIVAELGSMQARLRVLGSRHATADAPAQLSLTKAAPLLGVSPATACRMAEAGQIPIVIAGSRKKVSRAWLDAYSSGQIELLPAREAAA